MRLRWKSFDKTVIAEIMKELAYGPKDWTDLWNALHSSEEIGSKRTLNQYLDHLTRKGSIRKIVATKEGRRLAYEIVSEIDRVLAQRAKERESYSLGFPTKNPRDPKAISRVRESFKPSPKPSSHDHLSEKMIRLSCACLETLKFQLEIWRKIETSEKDSERLIGWIEDSFKHLFARIRMDFNWIALLMNAGFYTPKELMEALDLLHKKDLELVRVSQ